MIRAALIFLLTGVGCSTVTDKYAVRQAEKHAARDRAKFISHAYRKCVKNSGIPSRSKLIYGEFVSCTRGNNVIFSIKVP